MAYIPNIQITAPRLSFLMIVCVALCNATYPERKEEKLLPENFLSDTLGENLGESEGMGDTGGMAYLLRPNYGNTFWKRSKFWKRQGNPAFWKRQGYFW